MFCFRLNANFLLKCLRLLLVLDDLVNITHSFKIILRKALKEIIKGNRIVNMSAQS